MPQIRSGLLLSSSAFIAATVLFAGPAAAQSRPYNIPAEPLGQALRDFGKTSGQQVIYSGALVRGRTAPALRGDFTAEKALDLLLTGSGLHVERSPGGTVMIKADAARAMKPRPAAYPAPAPSPAPVEVVRAAEDEPASAGDQPGEIVVTAQKRTERLIDVPVPVTALEARTLINQNIVKLQDYATRVPGLRVTGNLINQISLRGIGPVGDGSPTVAVTIDDVPFGASTWSGITQFPDLDPADLSRIEVLRGPQGTLYGATSLGGLIKLVTHEPDPNHWSGRVAVGLGGIDGGSASYSARGLINVPIIRDMLAVSASVYRRTDSPYIDNIIVGSDPLRGNASVGTIDAKDNNKARYQGYRVSLFFKPVDWLTINVSRLEQERDLRNGGNTEVASATDLTPRFGYFKVTAGASHAVNKQALTQARVAVDLPFATLTSISGWGKTTNDAITESQTQFPYVFKSLFGLPPIYPGAPAGSFTRFTNATRTTKFTQEVRLASKSRGPLEWLVGGFYTRERSSLDQVVLALEPSGTQIGPVVAFPNPDNFREKAVFADASYHFTPEFDVQVGGRYSKNDQSYQTSQVVPASAEAFFGPSTADPAAHSSDHSFTWLITPRYRFSEAMMVYGRVASGYRPGGPNGLGAPSTTFNPDRVVNYELGAKGQLLERRLTYDLSLYDIEWDHIQLGATSLAGSSYLLNGAKARSYGFEGALQFAAGGGWAFTGNMTLANPKLVEDVPANPSGPGAPQLLGFKGDRLPDQPRFAANVQLDKSFSLTGAFRATLSANLSYVGQRDLMFRTSLYPAALQERISAPSYAQLDFYLRITDNVWDLGAYVRNVGARHGVVTVVDTPTNALPTVAFLAPRSFGFTLARAF